MPFDGNGNWTSNFSAVADRDANIKILASRFDGILLADIAQSFENCLTKDMQVKPQQAFNANNYRVINVSDPIDVTDAVNKQTLDGKDALCVHKAGTETITGDKTFSSTITGDISGNAGTVTNGVYTTGNQTIGGTKTFSSTISGSITGNAGTATVLQTSRTINGTNFNGSGNITTSKWGTARNVSISDSDATNTGSSVSVDGSGAVTLKLPSTIKATLTGNSSTATTLQTSRTINGTSFNGSANITTSNWGAARNISISDSDSTNTGTAVSVNGSGAVTLKLPSTIKASLTGNASTVTNGVYTTGNQTIGGTKTFSSTISGSITGNAGTVTNGVYTNTNQTITGNKTFSGSNTFSGAVSLNGTIDASQSVKQAIVGWGVPDYSSGISITSPYTVTKNGYIILSQRGVQTYDGSIDVSVNGVSLPSTYAYITSTCQQLLFVKNGDVVSFTFNNGSSGTRKSLYFPLVGG